MAPAKRRAGKAAACQKWKLDDLVLAKVKGFPAWPAKISEPELWGQTHDPKKVFVHFFGTQEIGFCAPLDVQTFTLELKNKLLARCQGKAASDFTRAVGEICEEYDNLEGEKQDFAPEIQRSKARECGESSNDSVEKIHYNEDMKMLTSGHDTEEMLEVQNEWQVQKHCQTMRENDLNQGIHRQLDSQKKQVAVVAAENKEKNYSLIKSAKKEENRVKEVPVGIKKHKYTPKTNNLKSSLKEEKTANHSEGRLKNNRFCAAPAMDESEIKHKKSGLKRSSDTESHNYRVDTGVDCHVKQQNQISSPDTSLIPDLPVREYKFGHHVLSIAKEVIETRLSPDRNLLELRKSATNNTETELEYLGYGNSEGNSQVSALKEKMKEKQDVESIQEIIMTSDKNLIMSPFIDKKNEEREVIGKFSQQNSILKKKRNPMKKHNPGASVLTKTSVDTIQTKDKVSVEDENVFEVLAAVEHRKKRTQLKGRKHKLHMDENLSLAKKARLHSEDESSKLPECLDIGGSTSAAHDGGKNCVVNNELSHDVHLKSAICSSIPQIEGSSPQGQERSFLTDRGTCLPPKADKYRLRSNLPGDEAALPPSKRRHRAQEAMSACVAAAATASFNTITAGSCGQNDAWGNSSDEKPFKGCFENEGMLVHANEECMKLSDVSSPVEETAKVVIKKSMAGSVSLQSHGSLPSEPSNRAEDKQVDLRPHGQRDKRQSLDNVNMNTHVKVLDGLPLSFVKMDEAKQNGSFEPVLPSPKKKDVSEPAIRKGNSPQPSPMKAHAVNVDSDHHEFKSKSTKVKKSCTTPAKKGGARKDLAQSSSEKLSQGLLHKHPAVRKSEHTSPIRGGVEPLDKVVASSKISLKINGAVAVKTEAISNCTDLHLEKGNKIREANETVKEVKFKEKSKEMDMAMSSTSLKHLIAAAQAKREQTRSANMPNHVANEEIVNFIPTFMSSPSPIRESSSHRSSPIQFHSGSLAPEENNNVFTRAESRSPRGNVQQWGPAHVVDMRLSEEHKISSDRKPFGGMLSDTEAAIARDTFEGMLETLSRTKESIGRASRHAIDCAKYGIAGEVVELLVQRLEIESSSHRKIDLFFLVDSITQCSHTQKGIAGLSYIPAVQAALPRLLAAAAPSGSVARENRRQCLKVLRLWLERKILPESILRQYMNDFGYANDDRPSGNLVRRPRVERAVDDPMREIEGKLDEYGSNATFHLPGFSMVNVFEDEEEPFTSDRKNNNESLAVETIEAQEDQTKCLNDPIERHCLILEDVDGELEMEDVSPTSEYDAAFCKDNIMQPQAQQFPHYHYPPDQSNPCRPLPPGSPPLPEDPPPSPPPLPASPPPPPPSSPPPPPPDSPPFVCQPPLPHSYRVPMNDPQPHLVNGNSQQPSHVVSNATIVDSIGYSSSGFPVSQIHHGQNVTSFNSPRSFEFLQSTVPEVSYSAVHAQQLQLNNSNLSFAQQSYLPPPPTIGLSSQFSFVRAEIQTNVRDCEKQSAQEDQWRLLHNDRCTGSENQLPINQAGSGKSTLCTNMQEVTPGICWPTGGPQYPSCSHLPTQNLTIRAPGGQMSNMDVGYAAYLDQSAGLAGGMVAAPTNQVMIQMLSSRSGYSAVNSWRPS